MKHLKENNIGYWTHLSFAMKLSAQLVVMAFVGIIHAIVPFLFENSVSSGIKEMDAKLQEMAG
jgi:hypothetical protein|tara:strand:- start:423 stop:611 length:189 start_codon:yes stop_codon:yes gene_type:complete